MYSHSKLQSFEQCPYRFKLRYIDKIPSPVEKSIEAHLGTCVHDTLEWLYNDVLQKRLPELDEVLKRYAAQWNRDYKEIFIIVKKHLSVEDYKNKGIQFLIDYYTKHKPFKDGTLELEKKIFVKLKGDEKAQIIGYIDRLVYNKETNEYEIHDYKTANSLPDRKKFEEDRQLALYSIGIKQLFGKDKKVALIWHYLNHNMKIESRRTDTQLEQLKVNILDLIDKIENTVEFPVKTSILCNWCEYKTYCKAHGNEIPQKYKEKQSQLNIRN